MIYDPLIEKLLKHFTLEEYAPEVLDGKLEYFEKMMPTIDENSEMYELRMSQFLDWYLFSRKLRLQNLTPIQVALEKFQVFDDEKQLYKNLSNAYHGVFEFVKIKDSDVYIKDLITKKTHLIKNSDIRDGFAKDQFFDVRLIPYNESFVFTKGFCFHPEEAKKYILGEAKKLKKAESNERESFLMKLNRMRAKVDQYKHIQVKFIYTNENTFKV